MSECRRLYYIGLSALCWGLCVYMTIPFNMLHWQWWLWIILSAYANQPIINEVRLWVERRQQRKRDEIDKRFYELLSD
jgi:hypothetical protein